MLTSMEFNVPCSFGKKHKVYVAFKTVHRMNEYGRFEEEQALRHISSTCSRRGNLGAEMFNGTCSHRAQEVKDWIKGAQVTDYGTMGSVLEVLQAFRPRRAVEKHKRAPTDQEVFDSLPPLERLQGRKLAQAFVNVGLVDKSYPQAFKWETTPTCKKVWIHALRKYDYRANGNDHYLVAYNPSLGKWDRSYTSCLQEFTGVYADSTACQVCNKQYSSVGWLWRHLRSKDHLDKVTKLLDKVVDKLNNP